MFYNIKIRKTQKRQGEWEGGSIPYYIIYRGDESDGVNGINGVDCGVLFFCLQGKKFFLTGEKLLEGKREF